MARAASWELAGGGGRPWSSPPPGPPLPSTPSAKRALRPPPAQLHPLCPGRRLPAGFRPWGCCQLCACVSALYNRSLTGSTVYPRCSESSLRSPASQRDHQNQGQLPELQRFVKEARASELCTGCGPGVQSRNQRSGSCLSKHERGNRPAPAAPGPGVAGTWRPRLAAHGQGSAMQGV